MALDDPATKADVYYIGCMLTAGVFCIGSMSGTGWRWTGLWGLAVVAFSLGIAVKFDGMNRRLWSRLTGVEA